MAVCTGRKRCRKSHDPPQLMIDTEVSKSMGKQLSTVVRNLSRHSWLNWWPPGECGAWFWGSGSLSDPLSIIFQHFRDQWEEQVRWEPHLEHSESPGTGRGSRRWYLCAHQNRCCVQCPQGKRAGVQATPTWSAASGRLWASWGMASDSFV